MWAQSVAAQTTMLALRAVSECATRKPSTTFNSLKLLILVAWFDFCIPTTSTTVPDGYRLRLEREAIVDVGVSSASRRGNKMVGYASLVHPTRI